MPKPQKPCSASNASAAKWKCSSLIMAEASASGSPRAKLHREPASASRTCANAFRFLAADWTSNPRRTPALSSSSGCQSNVRTMKANPSIVIADDHPIFREGLRKVIEHDHGGRVIAEAGDGETALRLIRERKPDIAVLDVVMPGLNGLKVARQVQREHLPVAVVFLTMFKEEDMFNEAMDAAAKGYVLKENAVSDIIGCLRSVASGQYFISPAISHLLVRRTERARGLASQTSGLSSLTPSERRILNLIARGK